MNEKSQFDGKSDSVFLSYNWKQAEIADEIEQKLKGKSIVVKRDINNGKWFDLQKYMQTIRQSKFVIPIISDSFLKSQNCMYEILQLMKDDDYKERIYPYYSDDANFFTSNDRLSYLSYWQKEYNEFSDRVSTLDTNQSTRFTLDDLRLISDIYNNIGEFLYYLKNNISPTKLNVFLEEIETGVFHSIVTPKQKKGFYLVVTGPSGVGRDAIVDVLIRNSSELLKGIKCEIPGIITTRAPREGEQKSTTRLFTSSSYFERLIHSNILMEWSEYSGIFYGTTKENLDDGIVRILVLGAHGAEQVFQRKDTDSVSVFIYNHMVEEQKIRQKGTWSEQAIINKMHTSQNDNYDYINKFDNAIENKEIDDTVCKLAEIIKKEYAKRNPN